MIRLHCIELNYSIPPRFQDNDGDGDGDGDFQGDLIGFYCFGIVLGSFLDRERRFYVTYSWIDGVYIISSEGGGGWARRGRRGGERRGKGGGKEGEVRMYRRS